jgi:Uma2 family endonuclease
VPVTLEDILHPREDDEFPQYPFHSNDCRYLFNVFSSLPLGPPAVHVSFDLLVHWGVPGQLDTSPDVAIFVGLREPPKGHDATLNLPALGGRCLLVVEIVTPERRVNDVVHKFVEYHRAGVPLYVIVDRETIDSPRRILGYRWEPHGYEEIAQDERGLLIEPLGLYLSLGEDRQVVCHNAVTGREYEDYVQLARRLEAVQQRIHLLDEIGRLAREQVQAIEAAKSALSDEERSRILEAIRGLLRAASLRRPSEGP